MNNYSNDRKVVNNSYELNSFLTKMYSWMSLAVLLSATTAYLLGNVFASQTMAILGSSRATMWILLIAWFILPMVISFQAMKRPTLSLVILVVYAILTGAMFSTIFLAYSGTSIAAAFLSSATIFITMTLFGLFTHRNLDKFGAQASAALIALIIASIINIFLKSSLISFVFSIIAVIIFTILTAYDTQKMKNIYNQYGNQVSTTGLAIYGALQLYLDFVNLFLQLLSIFGNSDRR
ncbi:Bax inhibitor-1/YccA family protein [Lentilactobacillus laojiaonis]|uniref:Bax inhibitor-1/YccA family protein n=1 Tax=Lentilactobacillus laojiaonis TaxID=2883998 RepID=UPI001D0A137C|nr:Bax inhibitor-1/YccA family protein [Lentilactobacillus laojiaonis]UDM32581.1 Bax inhibitor-1/YccA family protein [Lentilactobacillus laojiaonis]